MVSSLQVAAVRALVLNDVDEHIRLLTEIDGDGSVDEYGLFYKVVFAMAAHRRFGSEAKRGDVIRFVAQVRANRPRDAVDLDIVTAERVLYATLGDQGALEQLTDEDSALIAPLLIELGGGLPVDELLAEACEQSELLERRLAG
jgi:hypothetical protein